MESDGAVAREAAGAKARLVGLCSGSANQYAIFLLQNHFEVNEFHESEMKANAASCKAR